MVNDYLSIDPKKVTYNEKKRITNLLSPHCGFVVRDLGVQQIPYDQSVMIQAQLIYLSIGLDILANKSMLQWLYVDRHYEMRAKKLTGHELLVFLELQPIYISLKQFCLTSSGCSFKETSNSCPVIFFWLAFHGVCPHTTFAV